MSEANPPLVWIEWEDAATIDRWTPIAELEVAPHVCHAAGFMVREEKDAIAISVSIGGADGCGTMVIPKRCIVRRVELQPPNSLIPREHEIEDLRR